MKLYKLTLIFDFLLCTSLFVSGQSISKYQLSQIDSLFEEFKQGPPISYGIIHEGIILQNQFNAKVFACERQKQVRFRLGGMAPHFTAYAILLLEEEGKINLGDKVSDYISKKTSIDYKDITIIDLLSHAHGLPEYWALKYFQGYDNYTSFTTDIQDRAFASSLKNLYPRGSRISLSGTGPYLLAKIIQEVSGKSIYEFTQEKMFAPLKMKNTYFTNFEQINNIISYEKQGSKFEPRVIKHDDNGPAGLITTMEDMLIWFSHFDNKKAIDNKMDTPISFGKDLVAEIENGKITFGQQFIHKERGIGKIWDYGHIGGFSSSVFRFPEKDLTILILSKNGLPYNGYLGMQISDILLRKDYQINENSEHPKFVKMNQNHIEKFAGSYLGKNSLLHRKIILRNDTLRYYRPDSGSETNLFPISNDELSMGEEGGLRLYIEDNLLILTNGRLKFPYEKIKEEPSSFKSDKKFEGLFFCENLHLLIQLKQKGGGSFILFDGDKEIPLRQIDNDRWVSNDSNYKLIKMVLNAEKEINRLEISNLGLKDIEFRKLE